RVDELDEAAADATAAGLRHGEQVLQVAGRAEHPGRAEEEVVDDAEQATVGERAGGEHRNGGIKETASGRVDDSGDQGYAIEILVAGEQRLPRLAFVAPQRATLDRSIAHGMVFPVDVEHR